MYTSTSGSLTGQSNTNSICCNIFQPCRMISDHITVTKVGQHFNFTQNLLEVNKDACLFHLAANGLASSSAAVCENEHTFLPETQGGGGPLREEQGPLARYMQHSMKSRKGNLKTPIKSQMDLDLQYLIIFLVQRKFV